MKVVAAMMVGIICVVFTPRAIAENPCKTVICLFGELVGKSGGGQCRSAVADYFDIRKFDWKGFDRGATQNARADFLDRCKSADASAKRRIDQKFGRRFSF